MGKSTISMVIFNSYVKLPEGKFYIFKGGIRLFVAPQMICLKFEQHFAAWLLVFVKGATQRLHELTHPRDWKGNQSSKPDDCQGLY